MRLFIIPTVAALLALAAGQPAFAAKTPAATADEKGEKKGDGEKKQTKDGDDRGEKLPKAVAGAVKNIFPGMTVVKAEKEDEDGNVVYEITLRGKGGTLEAKLTPKGRVVEVELKGDGEKGKKKGEDDDKDEKKAKSSKKKGEGDDKDEKKGDGEKGKKKADRE
jgi:hypothetical protein